MARTTSGDGASDPRARASLLPASLLRPWLAGLVAMALLACGRAVLLPPWPRVAPLSPDSLQAALTAAGFAPKPLPAQPGSRSATLARSSWLAWQLQGGSLLRVVRVNARDPSVFQVAQFTRGIPSLAMSQRILEPPQAGVASGRVQGRPALQTCLVPQGRNPAIPAVTAIDLSKAVGRQSSSVAERLRALISFSRPRQFSCLLVTLQSSSAEPLPHSTWRLVMLSLQKPALHPQRPLPRLRPKPDNQRPWSQVPAAARNADGHSGVSGSSVRSFLSSTHPTAE